MTTNFLIFNVLTKSNENKKGNKHLFLIRSSWLKEGSQVRLDRRLLQLVVVVLPPPGLALGSGWFCCSSSTNDLDLVFDVVVVVAWAASSSSSFAKSETLNETNWFCNLSKLSLFADACYQVRIGFKELQLR